MSYNHLPPQAYSKETLIQAFNWLRHQPPQVQEIAKSTDMLISLYTKAQMYGDDYLNRNHMQNFKTELKSLANMMGEFEGEKGEKDNKTEKGRTQNIGSVLSANQQNLTPQGQQFQSSQQFQTPTPTPTQNQQPHFGQSTQSTSVQSAYSTHGSPQAMTPSQIQLQNLIQNQSLNLPTLSQGTALTISNLALEEQLKNNLDMKSIAMIQEVKNLCNLSNDAEALRLIITMGYNKIKTQF